MERTLGTAIVLFVIFVGTVTPFVGCAAGPGGDVPIIAQVVHQVSEAKGEGVIGSVWVGAFPWTYPLRWKGEGKITLQYPATPHIVLDGDFEWEPVYPDQAPAIQAEMAAGRIQFVRSYR